MYFHLYFHTEWRTISRHTHTMLVNACKKFFITSCVNIVCLAWHFLWYEFLIRTFHLNFLLLLLRLLFCIVQLFIYLLCVVFNFSGCELIKKNIHHSCNHRCCLSGHYYGAFKIQKLTHVFIPFIITLKNKKNQLNDTIYMSISFTSYFENASSTKYQLYRACAMGMYLSLWNYLTKVGLEMFIKNTRIKCIMYIDFN